MISSQAQRQPFITQPMFNTNYPQINTTGSSEDSGLSPRQKIFNPEYTQSNVPMNSMTFNGFSYQPIHQIVPQQQQQQQFPYHQKVSNQYYNQEYQNSPQTIPNPYLGNYPVVNMINEGTVYSNDYMKNRYSPPVKTGYYVDGLSYPLSHHESTTTTTGMGYSSGGMYTLPSTTDIKISNPNPTKSNRSPKPKRQQLSALPVVPHNPTVSIEKSETSEIITFPYTKNRKIQTYRITLPLHLKESQIPEILNSLPITADFKSKNAVYPNALVPPEQYMGRRQSYEMSVNELGWVIAWLNKHQLEGKKGVIQRCVDHWRNSRGDLGTMSRRARRYVVRPSRRSSTTNGKGNSLHNSIIRRSV